MSAKGTAVGLARLRGPLGRCVRWRGDSLLLRAATRRDVPAIARLQREAAQAEHRLIPDIAGRRLDERVSRRYTRQSISHPRRRLFVAAHGVDVIGTIGVDLIVSRHRLAHVQRRIYLHSLYVSPSMRRLGLAQRLTRLALDWGRGRGATQARLEMAAPNAGARRLYEDAGFRLREMMFARAL